MRRGRRSGNFPANCMGRVDVHQTPAEPRQPVPGRPHRSARTRRPASRAHRRREASRTVRGFARGDAEARRKLPARLSGRDPLTHDRHSTNRREHGRGTLPPDTGQYPQTVATSPAFLPERVPYDCGYSPIAGRFRPRVTPLDAGAFLFLRPAPNPRSRY